MTNKQTDRLKRLLPAGKPRWIRIYDNGGPDAGGSIDRYTVLYTGRYRKAPGWYQHVVMSAAPFHPQGFGQHGESQTILDQIPGRWGGVDIGRVHPRLGRRIEWEDLPVDCQRLVLNDYREIWELSGGLRKRSPIRTGNLSLGFDGELRRDRPEDYEPWAHTTD